MINNKRGRELFGQFLEKEFSAENLRFWIACQQLESCKDNKVMKLKCEEIFVTFLDIASPQEVSLDFRVKERLSTQRQDPNRDIFQEAQSKIYTLMHRDSFPRFLCSPVFKNLLQKEDDELSPSGFDSKIPDHNYDNDITNDNDIRLTDNITIEVTDCSQGCKSKDRKETVNQTGDSEVTRGDDELDTIESILVVIDEDPDSAQIETDDVRTVNVSDHKVPDLRTGEVSLSTLRLDTVENEFQAVLSNFMNEIAGE